MHTNCLTAITGETKDTIFDFLGAFGAGQVDVSSSTLIMLDSKVVVMLTMSLNFDITMDSKIRTSPSLIVMLSAR